MDRNAALEKALAAAHSVLTTYGAVTAPVGERLPLVRYLGEEDIDHVHGDAPPGADVEGVGGLDPLAVALV
jgi:hypothetical protein